MITEKQAIELSNKTEKLEPNELTLILRADHLIRKKTKLGFKKHIIYIPPQLGLLTSSRLREVYEGRGFKVEFILSDSRTCFDLRITWE